MENNINVVNDFLGTLEYAERPDSKSELLPESYMSIKDIINKSNTVCHVLSVKILERYIY